MSEVSNLLAEGFDVDNEEGMPENTLIPAGTYMAQIIDAVAGELKSKKGSAVSLTWEIMDDAHNGRRVWQHLPLRHESAKAQEFGRKKFKDVCAACGLTGELRDLTKLYHTPCSIRVVIEQDKNGQYPDKNAIGRVKAIEKRKGAPKNGHADADLNDDIPFFG